MFILLSICFVSCEKEDVFSDTSVVSKTRLRTVTPDEVAASFGNNLQKSTEETNWLKPYFEYNHEIELINSTERITVTPVVAEIPNAYSRLFSLEIDGELQTVVYHMFANDSSTATNFTGSVIVSSVSGDIISAFKVEENEFVSYYPIKDTNLNLNIQNLQSLCDSCDDDDWAWIDHLPEVIVEEPPSSGGESHFFLVWLFDVPELEDEGEGSGAIPDNPADLGGGSGNNTNTSPCPAGQIKDEFGNCIDPPEEEEEEEEIGICSQIENLINDQAFKDKMAELEGLTSGNFERGYTMTKNANGSFSYSEPTDGAPNTQSVDIPFSGQISGMIHSHYSATGMFSTFSFGDIITLATLYSNGHMDNVDTFVFGVVTFGGTYLLSISDAASFNSFINNLVDSPIPLNTSFNGKVSPTNTAIENEIGLISFLNSSNTGLTLYKGNTDNFNQWGKAVITRDGNINTLENCN